MRPGDLLEFTRKRPFLPSRIHATDGQAYDVLHPDRIIALRSRAVVGVGADNGVPDRLEHLPLVHIARIEELATDTGAHRLGQRGPRPEQVPRRHVLWEGHCGDVDVRVSARLSTREFSVREINSDGTLGPMRRRSARVRQAGRELEAWGRPEPLLQYDPSNVAGSLGEYFNVQGITTELD